MPLSRVVSQSCAGLQLRSRSGEWLTLAHSPDVVTVLVGDMLERLSAGYFAATPHRVLPTPAGQRARRSFVYFQAFDEEEPVSATTLAGARRTPVSAPFLAWLEALPEQARRRFAHPVTQREWTEADGGGLAGVAHCDVAPAPDRVLVFRSSNFHEVRPPWAPRTALTCWWSGLDAPPR